MADESTTTPDGGTPGGGTEPLTLEQVQAQLAEAQKRIKELNKESAERRKKLEAYEQAETDRKNSELSDLEKAKAELAKVSPELEKLRAEKATLQLQGAFEKTVRAMKLEFADEQAQDDAFKFLNRETVGDDQSGMKDAIAELQKTRSYLFGKFVPPNTDSKEKGQFNSEATAATVLDAKRREMGGSF